MPGFLPPGFVLENSENLPILFIMENSRWKHITGRGGEYPEVFIFSSPEARLKVEADRDNRKVKIHLETAMGDVLESLITNGVVLAEHDLKENRVTDLTNEFTEVGSLISTLPDHKILRIIGSNYGVISEFLGKVTQVANEDVKLLKAILLKIAGFPAVLAGWMVGWFRIFWDRPRVWDFFDTSLALVAAWYFYRINYSYLAAGLVLTAAALASGYADLLLRNRAPYALKVLGLSAPGFYIMTIALRWQ